RAPCIGLRGLPIPKPLFNLPIKQLMPGWARLDFGLKRIATSRMIRVIGIFGLHAYAGTMQSRMPALAGVPRREWRQSRTNSTFVHKSAHGVTKYAKTREVTCLQHGLASGHRGNIRAPDAGIRG